MKKVMKKKFFCLFAQKYYYTNMERDRERERERENDV